MADEPYEEVEPQEEGVVEDQADSQDVDEESHEPESVYEEPKPDPYVEANQRLLQTVAQQQEQLQMLNERLNQALTPSEPEYQDPQEVILKCIEEMDRRMTAREQQQACEAAASFNETITEQVLTGMAQGNEFLKNNPGVAKKLTTEAKRLARDLGAQQGRKLSQQEIQMWAMKEVNEWGRALSQSVPRRAADAAEQVKVNKKSVEMPGGSSPPPARKEPLDADGDEYWERERSRLRAARDRLNAQRS